MNRLALLLLIVLLVGCDSTGEDSFAALSRTASDSSPFRQPESGDQIRLPADLGVHPMHRIEWWYFTANLKTESGEWMGLQWTQFRQGQKALARIPHQGTAGDWPLNEVWMAHAALSRAQGHDFSRKLARGGTGQGDATASPFRVWLDDWQLRAVAPDTWRLVIDSEGWAARLTIQAEREVVRHGQNGFSAKSTDGTGSMYFSLVDLAVSGQIRVDGEKIPVQGDGWFDREWSSQLLGADQQGWDWMGLKLDNGARLMAFQLRQTDGVFQSGTWVTPAGESIPLASQDVRLEALARRNTERGPVPVRWRLEIPGQEVAVIVEARPGQYWNSGPFPYWESPVRVTGSHTGQGYLELTGYGDDS